MYVLTIEQGYNRVKLESENLCELTDVICDVGCLANKDTSFIIQRKQEEEVKEDGI